MPTTRQWVGATVLSVVALGAIALWLAATPLATRLVTRVAPPRVAPDTPETPDQERAALREFGRLTRGHLLWASNRGGNHDLYEADLATGSVRRLTDHPHVDFFGRYSPDGSRILFLRSRRPWVSFREEDGWDLWVMDASGASARRLAERVYHPAWMPDGTAITFLRQNTVLALSLADGTERVVHRGASPPATGDVGDPEPGPEGALGITLRGLSASQDGVGVLLPGFRRYQKVSTIRDACHVGWTPSGGLVWVETEGHGGTRIMHTRSPERAADVLIDLPGRYSHEYFPRVSPDGLWLLWGAAAEGHEHDRADYEIFAWRIGTDWSSALRLTYSNANDQWPDLRPR